jgi:hypothetical protein
MISRCRPSPLRYATCCGAFACRNQADCFDADDDPWRNTNCAERSGDDDGGDFDDHDFDNGDQFDPEPSDDNFDDFEDLDESDETDPPEEFWDEGDWD